MKTLQTLQLDWDISSDVILPELSKRDLRAKRMYMVSKHLSVVLLYWLMPWTIISSLLPSLLRLGENSFLILFCSLMLLSGITISKAKKDRAILVAMGVISYAMIPVLSLLYAMAI